MVETISPVVYGSRGRWATAFVLHVIGATVTAALFGAVLGALGGLLDAPWGRAGAVVLAAAAVVYAFGELPRVTATVPQLRRQVPDWWREFFSWPVAAFLYGAGLGVGFFTYLSHGTLVVVSVAAIASGQAWVGALVVAPFGLVRGLSAARGAGVGTPQESQDLVDLLASSPERRRAIANGVALTAVAVLAVVVAVRASDGWEALATAALALAFTWAAVSKPAGFTAWRRTIAAHELPPRIEAAAVMGVPIAEALVPVLAICGWTRASGVWALTLTVVFTAEALRAWRRFGAQVPCGCFGGREPVSPAALLLRNLALAVVAVAAALRPPPDPTFSWPGWPAPSEYLPMALVIAGVAVAIVTALTAIRWLGRGVRP
jgi:hypothetical protein